VGPTRSSVTNCDIWWQNSNVRSQRDAGLYLPSNIFAGYDSHLYDLYPAVDFAGYKNVLPSKLNVDR
jgi:hypothetical protein